MKTNNKKDTRQAKEQTCDTCAFRKGPDTECKTCVNYSNWVEA